jgi:peptidoglycan/xylan/chitin deacetylase (PgdA/CDA1 family)
MFRNKNLILTFHNVLDVSWFENVIRYLKSNYRLVDSGLLEDVFSNKAKLNNLCHITFDDGEKSFFNIAFPILKKYQVPATIFVSPTIITSGDNFWFQEVSNFNGRIINRILSEELKISQEVITNMSFLSVLKCLPISEINRIISIYRTETKSQKRISQNMSLSEIFEVQESGLVTIGAHTLNHPILSNETDDISYYEITNSIKMLQELLSTKINHFAYPNGSPDLDFGERERTYLKQNQISMAFSSESKFLNISDDTYCLPRVGLTYGNMQFIKLKLFLGNKWELVKSIRHSTELDNRKLILVHLNKEKPNSAY